MSALREQEKELNKFKKKKVKVVERNGQQVHQILTNPDPWDGEACERHDCLQCQGSSKDKAESRMSKKVYETVCKLCRIQGQSTRYIGVTGHILYKRGAEHTRDLLTQKELSQN